MFISIPPLNPHLHSLFVLHCLILFNNSKFTLSSLIFLNLALLSCTKFSLCLEIKMNIFKFIRSQIMYENYRIFRTTGPGGVFKETSE